MTRTSLMARLIAVPLLAGWLAACASTPPPPSIGAAEVAAAEQSGTLEQLYQQVTAEIAKPEQSEINRSSLEATKQEIGEKLAVALRDDIQRALDETPRVDGRVPVDALEAQRTRIEPMRTWSTSEYDALSNSISEEMKLTNAAIADSQAQLDALTETNLLQRLVLLDALGRLYGIGSEAQQRYASKRDALLSGLDQEVNQAIENEEFEKAREMLEIAKQVDPTDTDTVEKLATVDTKVFEANFWRSLENGNPDKAYALLVEISADESFDRIRENLSSSTDVMADYYASLGVEATKSGDTRAAYRRFVEARKIRELLGDGTPKALAAEAEFIRLLEKHYESAQASNQAGLAWGYLTVIQSMQADSPSLRRKLRETRETVLQRAIKRLSAAPFDDAADSDAKFGDAVASKVVQHLFETIPNDIRIIERQQLSDIMREKSLGGEEGALAAADYLVEGTIQEAKVDTVEKTGKQTTRVVTEQIEKPNPAYESWTKLGKKDREKTPTPPSTIISPRKEDVTIEVTLHRKVGLFSVSYRVIDATSAKVVFADSVRAKVQHEDTSSEGVELGDFKREFKLASLPSDVEILAELADQVSTEIGTALAEVLRDPELEYAATGNRFVSEDNFEEAADQFAYAIVLSERKELDVTELKQNLRDAAIAASSH
jgi:curli biogenesis system outer membrane secretion channel CsgG